MATAATRFLPRGRDLLRNPRYDRGTAFTAEEPPSHIVGPAWPDPVYLAHVMREPTRPLVLEAQAGMTGANFAVAERTSTTPTVTPAFTKPRTRPCRRARRGQLTSAARPWLPPRASPPSR